MPVYAYTCTKCGNAFEVFVRSAASSTDEPPTCPICGSSKVNKNISLFGVGKSGSNHAASAASCSSGPT